ncbi:MAG: hypothetical protein KF846_11390 [Cyclobacteriaceae bacterium]|nr:hypothetical protein [Cyclobacteriaceae bacterium]
MDIPRRNTTKRKTEETGTLEPDFYVEHGKIVFTAAYHLKRGYCCKSGCRHCPYSTGNRKLP